MAVTGRFAPSPSGRIHLGNILCCLLAWLSARQKGGRVILRIEDLDIARCPRRYGEQMCRDIQWLGLDWDGAVSGCSEATGGPGAGLPLLLYPGGAPCRQCSPPGGWTGGLPGDLPRSDRGAGGRAGPAHRPRPRPAAVGAGGGDHFHRRPHGGVQGVAACGLRGFSAAAVDGQRLSKRNADAGLDTLGERYTAPEILGKLAYLAGFNPSAEPRSGESLLEDFAWEKVPRADIRIPEGLF